jgi:hypothetical protein
LVEKGQFPLIDGDLFDEGFFHFVLRIPGVGEAVEESFEFGAVFAGEDDRFGAGAVDEGVEADALLSLRGAGAGILLRVAPVGPYLIDCSLIYLFCRSIPIGRGGKALWPRMNADERG